jgi:hypothetical protein
MMAAVKLSLSWARRMPLRLLDVRFLGTAMRTPWVRKVDYSGSLSEASCANGFVRLISSPRS